MTNSVKAFFFKPFFFRHHRHSSLKACAAVMQNCLAAALLAAAALKHGPLVSFTPQRLICLDIQRLRRHSGVVKEGAQVGEGCAGSSW